MSDPALCDRPGVASAACLAVCLAGQASDPALCDRPGVASAVCLAVWLADQASVPQRSCQAAAP